MKGSTCLAVDPTKLLLHGLAQFEVERRERFVEQQDRRAHYQRTGERYTLLLSAGEPVDRTLFQSRWSSDKRYRVGYPLGDLLTRTRSDGQSEANILGYRHVREEPVALEHHVGRPLLRRQPRHVLPLDSDRSGRWQCEAANHAQQCRFSAPRRPEDRGERSRLHVEVDRVDGSGVSEGFGDAGQTKQGFFRSWSGFCAIFSLMPSGSADTLPGPDRR